MKAVFTKTEQKLKASFRVIKVVPVEGLATLDDLNTEIENRKNADIEISNNLLEIDSKVDGININLTRQIDDLEQDVNTKYNELVNDIDEEIQAREQADTTINQRITDVADELGQQIEENVVALQQEDTALQNQINVHSQTLTAYDTRITNNANEIVNINSELDNKQDTLISGENIKTINNTSILGSGNIEIRGASSFAELEGDPYDNQALANVLNSLDIISLLSVYLKDSFGYNLVDKNGLTLLARR